MGEQTDADSIQLSVVKERFLDAERALSEVQSRLERLHASENSALSSAKSLEETSATLRGFTETAAQVSGDLGKLQKELHEAVEAAAVILRGEELKALQDSSEQLRRSVGERFTVIERQLRQLIQALPSRWRRRLENS